MNRIITIAKVRARLSLPDDPGINAAITSARDAAHIHLAHLLDFVLEAGVQEDTFFIDARRDVLVDGLYSLRLSSGFVGATPVAEVRVSDTLLGLASASPLDPATYLLLAEKGFVRVDGGCAGQYVKITYFAGIPEDSDAPEWLVEAMIGSTIKVLSQQQVQDGKQEITKVIPALNNHLSVILDPHLRFRSESIRPLG